VQQELERVHT